MLADRRRWLVALVLSLAVLLAGTAGPAAAQGAAAAGTAQAGTAPSGTAQPGTEPSPSSRPPGAPAGLGEAPADADAALAVAPPAVVVPRVRAVHRLLVESAGEAETAEAAGAVPARAVGLGDVVAVEVSGLDALIAEAGGIRDLVLFLDGLPLAGLAPLGVRLDRGWLIYRLDRTDGADAAWHLLLGSPSSMVRELSVSVGADESRPIATDVEAFPLAVIHLWELAFVILSLTAALIGSIAAARRTDLLRDRTARVPAGAQRPYSLARCQMACWFFLVVAAYLLIWMAIDELDTITPSVLALIGIGAATALGAGMIDNEKKQSGEEAARALETASRAAERVGTSPSDATAPGATTPAGTATQGVAPQGGTPPNVAKQDLASLVAHQIQMSRLEQRAVEKQGAVKGASRGFLRDVLWDGDGISLHRVQIVVWTVVLGFIFVASVYAELAMPDFSPTLLGLMGISSGTYLGFKLPERQQA